MIVNIAFLLVKRFYTPSAFKSSKHLTFFTCWNDVICLSFFVKFVNNTWNKTAFVHFEIYCQLPKELLVINPLFWLVKCEYKERKLLGHDLWIFVEWNKFLVILNIDDGFVEDWSGNIHSFRFAVWDSGKIAKDSWIHVLGWQQHDSLKINFISLFLFVKKKRLIFLFIYGEFFFFIALNFRWIKPNPVQKTLLFKNIGKIYMNSLKN